MEGCRSPTISGSLSLVAIAGRARAPGDGRSRRQGWIARPRSSTPQPQAPTLRRTSSSRSISPWRRFQTLRHGSARPAVGSRSLVRGSSLVRCATSRERVPLPAAMLIQLDDHTLVDDLCVHFTRSGLTARSVRGGTVEIARHVLSTEDKDRREILLHLRDWQIVNPGATATDGNTSDDASQGPP
jgi:hypothetical protein